MRAENLIENTKKVGDYLINELKNIPEIKEVRGLGLMIGLEFNEPIKELRTRLLKEEKIFTGVSGTHTIRLLPPLCLSLNDAKLFIKKLKSTL